VTEDQSEMRALVATAALQMGAGIAGGDASLASVSEQFAGVPPRLVRRLRKATPVRRNIGQREVCMSDSNEKTALKKAINDSAKALDDAMEAGAELKRAVERRNKAWADVHADMEDLAKHPDDQDRRTKLVKDTQRVAGKDVEAAAAALKKAETEYVKSIEAIDKSRGEK
jgi:hypothetical protein